MQDFPCLPVVNHIPGHPNNAVYLGVHHINITCAAKKTEKQKI